MRSSTSSRVTAITVAFNSAAVIGACLERLDGVDRILMVDNASSDNSQAVALKAAPRAQVIQAPRNLGYGNGANLGLSQVASEFALLINPDAMLEPGAVEALVAAADRYPDAALFAPSLLDADGRRELVHNVGLFDQHRRRADLQQPADGDVSAAFLSAPVLLGRMAVLRAVGFYDPMIFLYYEDDDLFERVRAAGHAAVQVADARARHANRASTPPSPRIDWIRYWHMAWSRLYLERKHRGGMAMLRVGLPLSARYASKALLYALIGRRTKSRRDAARFLGGAMSLLGMPSWPGPPNAPRRGPAR